MPGMTLRRTYTLLTDALWDTVPAHYIRSVWPGRLISPSPFRFLRNLLTFRLNNGHSSRLVRTGIRPLVRA